MAEQLVELNVTGMHCNNCAMSIHKLLEKKGLQNVLVSFASEEVKFSTADQSLLPGIISDIENLGFHVVDDIDTHKTPFYDKVENKFIFCALFYRPAFAAYAIPLALFAQPDSAIIALPACVFGRVPAFW
jgi:Cu+-exporting ATPase